MKALLFAALLLQQAPAPAPFEGSIAQGLKRVAELSLAAQKDEALALSESLLAKSAGRERAAVQYARGVVHAGAKERAPAGESFERSRADGAGELRLASMYNLGSLALEEGEEWFHQLPEVSGKPAPAQPPSAAASGAAPGAAPAPDPLAEARKSYLAARARLVERLRAQWNDADTRANAELVQKRLKQLDEIEKKRKEEEQKKKDEQQKQQQKKQDDKQQQDKDKQDPKDPKDPKPEDKDPKKDDPKQDPKADPKDDPKQDPKQPDEPKPDDPKKDDPQQPPKDPQEKQISQEEMTRLLDKLQQLEEQAAKLRAQIHKARRVAVKKDW